MVSYPNFISNNAKNLNKILNHDPMMQPIVQNLLKHRWIQGVQPPSPPEPLAVPTKRVILSCMAGMGFNPLVDTLRRKKYNHEMATFLLLQSQAFSIRVKPVHKAAEKTSCQAMELPTLAPEPTLPLPTVGIDTGRLSRGASQAAYRPFAAAATCHPGLGSPRPCTSHGEAQYSNRYKVRRPLGPWGGAATPGRDPGKGMISASEMWAFVTMKVTLATHCGNAGHSMVGARADNRDPSPGGHWTWVGGGRVETHLQVTSRSAPQRCGPVGPAVSWRAASSRPSPVAPSPPPSEPGPDGPRAHVQATSAAATQT
ncbi:Sperm motility kinase W [Fukomys damarensis]|uniref:Sperm motility kinase W n=1 Tax=Fukomys damarensis TaxID=885580 RepID=A0A091DNG5_FUKDA|nr:Sperm motility kinase W [Fukomys damarensis]